MTEPLQSRFAPYVGRTSEPIVYDVERGHIRRFAEAIGDANPIYYDRNAARVPAPPTFAISLRANDPRAGIDVDFRKLLHGEQELVFDRALYSGDRLTVVGKIAGAAVKQTKSGVMDVMVLETIATDAAGARVFVARSTVLVRR